MTFHGDATMVKALKHIKEHKTEGDRRRFLDEYFDEVDDRRDAMRCLHCRDTGWVMVFHPEVIVAACQDKPVKDWSKNICMRCSCDAGSKKPSRYWKGRRKIGPGVPVLTFGEQPWHIAVGDPDGRAKCATFDVDLLRQHGEEGDQGPEERKPY